MILTAALGLAGLSASMAQVYSVNIVGYVNVPVTSGVFKMIANPLNTTSNTIGGVLTQSGGVQDGDQFLLWNGTGYTSSTFLSFLGGWDAPTLPLAPGQGGFYFPGANTNLTFVGEVLTGSLTNTFLSNFRIVSSQVPQGGNADALGLTAALADGDQVLRFTGTGFTSATKLSFLPGGWDTGVAPTINVGESVFVNSAGGSWTRTFNP